MSYLSSVDFGGCWFVLLEVMASKDHVIRVHDHASLIKMEAQDGKKIFHIHHFVFEDMHACMN